jgi:putative tryptophan/tyrosine transport system substrate-binding protein
VIARFGGRAAFPSETSEFSPEADLTRYDAAHRTGAGMRRRKFMVGLAAAAAFPLAARAQQTAVPVVGVLSPQSPGPMTTKRVAGFLQGLSELQYVAGQNVAIEYRWAEGHYDRLPALAADLVRRQVAVIVAPTQDAALAAKAATATIPIVFNVGGDPVGFGLVSSMNRPGGNATGVSMFTNQLEAKRLGLLQEMVPRIKAVGLLMNPDKATAENQLREVQAAARSLGLQFHVGRASSDPDIDAAFASLVEAGAQALLTAADPFLASRREKLVALATKHSMPAMWEWPDFVESGGLMSYGTSIVDNYRQVGVYTGKVLKGEKPAELPVMQPVKFELAINLNTANTLGIDVPATLIARADEVIE